MSLCQGPRWARLAYLESGVITGMKEKGAQERHVLRAWHRDDRASACWANPQTRVLTVTANAPGTAMVDVAVCLPHVVYELTHLSLTTSKADNVTCLVFTDRAIEAKSAVSCPHS